MYFFEDPLSSGTGLAKLLPVLDRCEEKAEFHTFVYDGPLFRERVKFSIGETVVHDERFVYTDLV